MDSLAINLTTKERSMITTIFPEVRKGMIAAGRTNHLSNVILGSNTGLQRKTFDPTSRTDRLQYARFLIHGKWVGSKSFTCEVPYHTVPATVERSLLNYFLQSELVEAKKELEKFI